MMFSSVGAARYGSMPAEGHHDPRGDVLLDEEMVRPAAPKVVGRDLPVVVIAGLVGGRVRSVADPVLDLPLFHIDKGVFGIEAVLLIVAGEEDFHVAGEPRLAVLPAVVLAGRVLPRNDLQLMMTTVLRSGDVFGSDVERLGDAEAAVSHQPDRYLPLERRRGSGEFVVLVATHPDVPGAVLVTLGTHYVLVKSFTHIIVRWRPRSRPHPGRYGRIVARFYTNTKCETSDFISRIERFCEARGASATRRRSVIACKIV